MAASTAASGMDDTKTSSELGKLLLPTDYNPTFTYVVVQKRISTRAPREQDGRQLEYDNPPPGTVLDHTVTRFKFQGLPRPTSRQSGYGDADSHSWWPRSTNPEAGAERHRRPKGGLQAHPHVLQLAGIVRVPALASTPTSWWIWWENICTFQPSPDLNDRLYTCGETSSGQILRIFISIHIQKMDLL